MSRTDADGTMHLLVVEDNPTDRSWLVMMLDGADVCPHTLAYAETLATAEVMLHDDAFDCVLLDLRLPDGDGVLSVPDLIERYPGAAVLIVTGAASHAVAIEAMRHGARGCVSKDDRLEELVGAIRTVHAGGTALSSSLVPGMLSSFGGPGASRERLTDRELEVLELLAEGHSTAAIAARLVISKNTVRNHVRNTLVKLGAHSQREAVAIALREEIVSPPR